MNPQAGTHRPQANTRTQKEPRNPRLALFASAAFDLIVPLAVYYLLRQAGVPLLTAAIIGGIVPVARTIYVFARYGKIDGLGIFMVTMMIIGTAVSLISGDARFFFAKDGWLTGMFGIWMLITMFFEKPFFLHAGVSIARTKTGNAGAEAWERRWYQEAGMRHGLRVLTVVFGIGMILDAVVRVVLAYALPIDDINLVTTVQWVVVLGGLVGFMQYYTNKHNLRA